MALPPSLQGEESTHRSSDHDKVVYHAISDNMATEALHVWEEALVEEALIATMNMGSNSIKPASYKKALSTVKNEVQVYVGHPPTIEGAIHSEGHVWHQADTMYMTYGITVQGFVAGADSRFHGQFGSEARTFGPTAEIRTFLSDLLWKPLHVRQHITSLIMSVLHNIWSQPDLLANCYATVGGSSMAVSGPCRVALQPLHPKTFLSPSPLLFALGRWLGTLSYHLHHPLTELLFPLCQCLMSLVPGFVLIRLLQSRI